jgi:membrane protein required for colicin V production
MRAGTRFIRGLVRWSIPHKDGSLNWVDVILAVVLLGFAIRGFMRGFLREIVSLVGLFLGLWIALLQFAPLGQWVQSQFPLTEPLPFHLAFLAIFLSVASLAGIIGYLLHRVAKGLLMGWLDASVGLGFGSVKGVMILTVLLFLMAHLPLAEPIKTQLRTSTLVEYLELFNPFLERSVQAYRRLGGERLWEQFRAPAANRPPAMSEGRRAGDAFRR